jgi:hypothetical protein
VGLDLGTGPVDDGSGADRGAEDDEQPATATAAAPSNARATCAPRRRGTITT